MGKKYIPNIGQTAKIITSKIKTNLGSKPKKGNIQELKNLRQENLKIQI